MLGPFFIPAEPRYQNWSNTRKERTRGPVSFVTTCAQWLSRVPLFATLRTAARQAAPSMGFSRQEYWSGVPFPPPGDLPNPRMEPVSLGLPSLAGRFFSTEPSGEPPVYSTLNFTVLGPLLSCHFCEIKVHLL